MGTQRTSIHVDGCERTIGLHFFQIIALKGDTLVLYAQCIYMYVPACVVAAILPLRY